MEKAASAPPSARPKVRCFSTTFAPTATAAPATYEMSDEVKAGFENCFTYTESGYEKDEDPNAEDITTGAKNGLKLADLRGVDYNDSK